MQSKIKLFGTDGIRRRVGQFPLDDDSLVKLGAALGTLIPGSNLITGRDTRDSGPHIENLIGTGILGTSPGAAKSPPLKPGGITGCGIIPTPGLSFAVDHGDYDYGIMITASHNPYTDNGIKIFGSDGEKIPEAMETQIEDIFFHLPPSPVSLSSLPSISHAPARDKDLYRDFLSSQAAGLETGIKKIAGKIVLDCAHGATFELAPRVFRELGLESIVLHAAPDGKNINQDCGSTCLEPLKETVINRKADLGMAFDGDGDRVLFVDNAGRTLDGDYTLYILSRYFLRTRSREDFNKIVVGTVMGNLGLEKSLERLGITYIRTPVGDKYVYREMKQRHSILGGEQSGHTILRSFQKTGDGILTALYFLKSLVYLGIKPAEVFGQLTLYPQVTKNITIKEKKDLSRWDQLNERIAAFNERHGDNSRLLIRYSGTEPPIRLMMESEHRSDIDENLGKFEQLITAAIGAESNLGG